MTSIIPIRPFGKDLSNPQDLESAVNTNPAKLPITLLDPSAITPYDFSKVQYRLDKENRILYFLNVPYNRFVDNHWKQGVWSEVGLILDLLPGVGLSEKRYFDGWMKFQESASSAIVPPLPLLFAVWASQYALELRGEISGADAKYLSNFRMDDATNGIYTSSFVNFNRSVNEYVFDHGCGLSNHPARYVTNGTEFFSGGILKDNLFGCSDEKLIDKVIAWRQKYNPAITIVLKFSEMDSGNLISVVVYNHQIAFEMTEGENEFFARGILADPNEYRVSP